MSRYLMIGAALLFAGLCGCTAPPPQPDDALVEALADLHLLEARHEQIGDVPDAVRDSVLAAHGFTTATFLEHLDQLTRHPALGDSTYARVERRLEARRQDLESRDR